MKNIKYKLLNTIRGGSYAQRQVLPLIFRLVNRKLCVRRKRFAHQLRTSQYTEIPKDIGFIRAELTDMSVAEEVILDAEEKAKHPNNKQTLQGIYDPLHYDSLEEASLDLESPYLRFCLQDEIIGIVSRYFGEIPILTSVGVWNSSPKYFVGDGYSETQFFHCDGDGNTQIKIFLYATNVTKESGPFTIMDVNQSRIARRRLRYRYYAPKFSFRHSHVYRVTDDEMRNVLPNYSITECIGDRGSIFMGDPGKCFHYGARTEVGHSRVMAWFSFHPISQTYIPKKKSRLSPPFRSLAASSPNLSETQRLVLGSR